MRFAWIVVALVCLVASVWASGYSGRVELREAQLRACERGKLDRVANATGWARAALSWQVTADNPQVVGSQRRTARVTARVYRQVVADLKARADLKCRLIVPAVRKLPKL